MTFKNDQKKAGLNLIHEGFFDGDKGGGEFFNKSSYPFVLEKGCRNLFPDIREDTLQYFEENKIGWWGGSPSGHILSSQIACLNHLFPLRKDEKAALKLLKAVSNDFKEVLPIEESSPGYIAFEVVGGDVNFLNEGINRRGRNCTSIDACMYALHNDGRRILIMIEWKYVEAYSNEDKSKQKGGETRKSRYLDLIEERKKSEPKYFNENILSCCWFEPFYQLMRQTLWVGQVLQRKPNGFEADDYLHLHVIPEANTQLLNKKYKCSGQGMEDTWKSCLTELSKNKYIVISPEEFWSKQDVTTGHYANLNTYLKERYWSLAK
ncbi:MAG: hypothetical protein LBS60_07850 [Deltaproteobacteria bacterium]|jgi:hypothetical protein|nr:hypothetical protein [Deltaproteobacteria bacterium]